MVQGVASATVHAVCRQVIVNTELPLVRMFPVICAFMRSRDCHFGGFAFFLFYRRDMKLYILFALIDLLIVLAYPFLFIASKMRQFLGFKR